MNSSTGDLRLALRGLRRSPLFSIVAILSLALGIGANTAIFTLIDQILLRKLPVQSPDQLVMLYQRGPHNGSNMGIADALVSDLPGLSEAGGAAVGGPVPPARAGLGEHRQSHRAARGRDGVGQLLHDARRAAGASAASSTRRKTTRSIRAIPSWCSSYGYWSAPLCARSGGHRQEDPREQLSDDDRRRVGAQDLPGSIRRSRRTSAYRS